MSEYIEDRITDLLARVANLENAVEDFKEQMNILADDYKIFRMEDYTDQSTEEFVKVVRCSECRYNDDENRVYCPMLEVYKPDGYCYKGKRR